MIYMYIHVYSQFTVYKAVHVYVKEHVLLYAYNTQAYVGLHV